MAYPYPLKLAPTSTNLAAARDLSRPAVDKFVQLVGSSVMPLVDLVQADEPPTPAQIVDALQVWREAAEAIDQQAYFVAGIAIMGGAAVTTSARKMRVRPATLSERLAETWAMLRGRDLHLVDGSWQPK